jgi:hypothetical protein
LKNKHQILITALVLILLVIFGYALYWIQNDKAPIYNSENRHVRVEASYFRELSENGAVIIYPAGSAYSEDYKKIVQKRGFRFRRARFNLLPDISISDSLLADNNLIILGSLHSNILFKILPGDFPLAVKGNGFTLFKKYYGYSKDVMHLLYKNPFNTKKFIFVISGNDDREILKHYSFFSNTDFSITKNGTTLLMGNFSITGDNKWIINKDEFWDFQKEKKVYLPAGHLRFIYYSDKTSRKKIDSVSAVDEKDLAEMQNFFGKWFRLYTLNYNIYDSFEEKGLVINNTDISNYEPSDSSVHVVMSSKVHADDFSAISALELLYNFGLPKIPLLAKGLAIHFSRNWRFKGYTYWAGKFYLADNVPDISELLDSANSKYESPLLVDPLAGVFVDFLISKYGKEKFIRYYNKWIPADFKGNEFRNEWMKYLSVTATRFKQQIGEDRKQFPSVTSSFLKGFSYAHTGYSIYNGYLSEQSLSSLTTLKSLGVDAISITPFTSIRLPDKPEPLRFWESPGSENDGTMIFLKNAADSLGFTVMLKPHIWVGRGGWPGDIKMKNENDWSKFFNDYYKWIRHYAILAEMYRIPILCIGNEMSQTTVGHEKEWTDIIDKLRKIYDGKLTYGANWNNEFEDITFWNKLDYIGISQYFPLSTKKAPSDEELLAGADSAISIIDKIRQKYNKPVLFTEAGYRNSKYPWETAIEENPMPDSSGNEQARAYSAMLRASYNIKWLAGIFWWKWPSNLRYGDSFGRDLYVPPGKPAQDVIKKWYDKKWN